YGNIVGRTRIVVETSQKHTIRRHTGTAGDADRELDSRGRPAGRIGDGFPYCQRAELWGAIGDNDRRKAAVRLSRAGIGYIDRIGAGWQRKERLGAAHIGI